MTTTPSFLLDAQRGKDIPDALLAFLHEHKGQDVRISLEQVQTLSGRQIELLLAGYKQWQTDGHSLVLECTDQAVRARLIDFDLPPHLFSEGE